MNGSAGSSPEMIAVAGKSKPGYEFIKRVCDIVLSLVALIVLLPLLLVISLVIFLDDPHGSPLFVQKRSGKDGREFNFYKFRSMCVNAEDRLDELLKDNEMTGPAFKIAKDPRITRVGGFIRKTSIDELPQLLNIICGDMSIVGPRPVPIRESAMYTPRDRQRLSITPGLTCYWQIQPHRNKLTFDEWLELDLKYIRERSFMTDVKIILKTIKAVFAAYGV